MKALAREKLEAGSRGWGVLGWVCEVGWCGIGLFGELRVLGSALEGTHGDLGSLGLDASYFILWDHKLLRATQI